MTICTYCGQTGHRASHCPRRNPAEGARIREAPQWARDAEWIRSRVLTPSRAFLRALLIVLALVVAKQQRSTFDEVVAAQDWSRGFWSEMVAELER